ncbi:TatD family hydrolase [Idiomarina sp. HP20-50]|uniref:TatD family hydrolase n=1 Tax=Idiomarina sp. HP20-50 TaxID=3070813 RepID=UPI00294B2B04|nr:TatD family hydrolase [Idiomarina sp. HP20-50]MDV6317131.1 TatD family hydrolase [Idiomarina sp. HP20-50]
MQKLYDTHCHIDFKAFDDDRAEVIKKAREAGVGRFMVPGVSVEQWPRLQQLANNYSSWRFGLGLHPWFIEQHSQDQLSKLEQALDEKPKHLLAIGEIGLDATCEHSELQRDLFIAQLKLAKEYRLPAIIHHRKTLETTHPLVKQHGPESGVIHAFSGSYEQAMKFVDCGYKLGVGGVITYTRAQKTRQAITEVPLSALVLETDSPDMPTCGYQGQRNEPAKVVQVLDVLAELREMGKESLSDTLWRNSCELFNDSQSASSDHVSD